MKISVTRIPEVLLIEPDVFGDERGFFMEAYRQPRYANAGISGAFVQDNVSRSTHGTLRGLHLQQPNPQGKLVYVLDGEVFDVAVDVRVGSPTFGHWVGETLSAANRRQLWVPPGFAHGFCVTGEHALFCYKCTDLYHPEHEIGIRWDDPGIGISWPIAAKEIRLSHKDAAAPVLSELDPASLPAYAGRDR